VSGTFDVDRCDYLLRDAHATGVSYGSFDLDWLLRSLRFGVPHDGAAPPLAIDGAKGIPAIESFLLARLFMFQQVYFHKTERASEWMLSRILERVGQLTQDGVRLEATPRAIAEIALAGQTTLDKYLKLDDATLWVALASWCDATDPLLANLCQRFAARNLFKTYELFGEQATPPARLQALETVREIAEQAGLSPDVYVGLDAASTVAFDDSEDPLTVVFPNGKSRALSEVSFLLGRLRGERMERVRLVFAPELRDRVVAALGAPQQA
jgi:HD superfamily phosphohydrolase